MELSALIASLSDPAAYPHPVDAVEVHQTHISVVFLAGPFAYKVKKPLDLGFLDYSTPEARRLHCEREVALNRRLAPSVYLGVVPVALSGEGLRMDGPGEAIDWAVKMERLPEGATLGERLRRGEVDAPLVEGLAARVAAFHAEAESGPRISASASLDAVARNARENFDESESRVGRTVDPGVFDRLRGLTEEALARLRPAIEGRAARDVPRDTHGDLRLGHVYLFPEKRPPDDLVIVDCIEFADRFRHADPVADMAFLAMDFARHGRRDLAKIFAEAYFRATGDDEGRALLPFYAAYRAAVKAKVEGLKLDEREIPEARRAEALQKARACWLVALGELEAPGRRPGLAMVGGLPGAGKSTLARALAERAGFAVIRSDLVRKELAGLAEGEAAPSAFGGGIYGPGWDERTYEECLRRAEAMLFEGKRVLVDASFGKEANRRRFLDLAGLWGVPGVFLLCRADPALVRERLEARRGDASDADWAIHLGAAARWEPTGPDTQRATREIDAGGDRDRATSRALDALRDIGLAG